MNKQDRRRVDPFNRVRKTAWARSRSQAHYRGEQWNLDFEDYCRFWPTEDLWLQRGRGPDNLVLYRYDPEQPWAPNNCCIITRLNQLLITAARRCGKNDQEYFKEALWI